MLVWFAALLALVLPWQCDRTPPFVHRQGTASAPPNAVPTPQVEPARADRTGHVVTERETLTHANPTTLARVPDEVVMKVIELGRAGFDRCFKRSVFDPAEPVKAKLHLELAADGAIVTAHADVTDEKLARCLERVARGLAFPAPGRAAAVDLPLFFRAQ